MAVDANTLLVKLEARIDQFEKQMAKARAESKATQAQAESSFAKINSAAASMAEKGLAKISEPFENIKGLIEAVLASELVRGLYEAGEAFDNIQRSLRFAGLTGEEAEKTFERLKDIAEANGAPFEDLAQLYSKLATAQKDFGLSSAQVVSFVEEVAAGLRVSGKSADQARGAINGLTVLLESAVVKAQPFNTILKQVPALAQAAANGLLEAGGSIAQLTQLIENGDVSSQAFFHALVAGKGPVEDLASSTELTLGQAIENLRTRLIVAAGTLDEATHVSGFLKDALNDLGNAADFAVGRIEALAHVDLGNLGTIGQAIQRIIEFSDKIDRFGGKLLSGDLKGAIGVSPDPGAVSELSSILTHTESQLKAIDAVKEKLRAEPVEAADVVNPGAAADLKAIEAAAEKASGAKKALKASPVEAADLVAGATEAAGDVDDIGRRIGQAFATIKPIPAEGLLTGAKKAADDAEGIAKRVGQAFEDAGVNPKVKPVSIKDFPVPPDAARAARAARTKLTPDDIWQRDIQQIEERTDALRLEAEMVGRGTFETTRNMETLKLLQEAEKAGIPITDKVLAQIDDEATKYANATVALEQAKKAHDDLVKSMDAVREAAGGVLSAFDQELENGGSLTDALNAALKDLLSTLIRIGEQKAIASLFGEQGTTGGGIFGSLLNGIFGAATGGAGLPAAAPALALPRLPVAPALAAGSARREAIDLRLTHSDAFVSEIADRQIVTHAGTIINLSVKRAAKASKDALPQAFREAQLRSL